MVKSISNQRMELARISRFIAFGLAGTTVDFLSFRGFVSLGLEPELAKALGYLLAISFTTLFITRFVFRVKVTSAKRLKTMALYLFTGTLNVFAFSAMLSFDMSQNEAFLLATILAASINYVAVKALSLT